MVFKALNKRKRNHEQVIFCSDRASGLKAIIAIHSSYLGPALGGCRMYPYKTEEQALEDVLRLSEAMSYKAAMAGLKAGGGKSVIIGNPETDKSPQLLEAFGWHIESLAGRYIVAKDMGIRPRDLQRIATKSSYVLGRPLQKGGLGDPSYSTAKGVFYGIKEAVKWKLKKDSLKGIRVLVQGLGAVGRNLVKFLNQEEAQIFVFDIKQESMKKIQADYPHVKPLTEEEVYSFPCDVFAPCSVGSVINEETIKQLNCSLIAGGANNQLSSFKLGKELREKNILYIPDFIINSGGLIYVHSHLPPKKTQKWIDNKIEEIALTICKICDISKAEGLDTAQTALKLAREKIKKPSS